MEDLLPIRKSIAYEEGTRGTETSQYLEEKKEKSISRVAASVKERAQTREHAFWGCGPAKAEDILRGIGLESPARERKSRVIEKEKAAAGTRVPQDTRNPAGSMGGPPPKAKYDLVTDSA